MHNPDFLFPTFEFDFVGGEVRYAQSLEQIIEYIHKEKIRIQQEELYKVARLFFKNDSEPFEMSPGEFAIFNVVVNRLYPRVQVCSSTQYGKTLTISRALLMRLSTFPEEWLVTVPDTKRGKILLNYIIKDSFDNDYFKKKLSGVNLGDRGKLEHLLEERSKLRLTFQILGEENKTEHSSIQIVTTEARRKNDAINAIMGFGGKNVLSDESSLIDDEIEAGIFRMLAGKGEDTCYIKVGNPFYRNHFYKSWRSYRYKKVFIDYLIGLAEGRYVKDFIDEAREKPKFRILFETKFPEADAIDKKGYSQLLTEKDLDRAYLDQIQLFGELRLGGDVAGGGRNFSTIVLRGENGGKLLYREHQPDTMVFAGIFADFAKRLSVQSRNCFIDTVGIGKGAYDRVRELVGEQVVGVNGGEKPEDEEAGYINLRAQAYWRMQQWINGGAKLEKHASWDELLNIRWKTQSDRKIKIMSKDEMLEEGIESPDVADALMLTFAKKKRTQQIYKQSDYAPTSEYEG